MPSRDERAQRDLGSLLWQVGNHWQAAQRAALRPLGLTHVQYALLAALTDLKRPATQRELAEHAGADPMMTSQVVRVLERNGWVVREPHPADGRAWALRPTRSGISLARRAHAVAERCDEEFFATLGRSTGSLRAALLALRRPPRDGRHDRRWPVRKTAD